MSLETIYSLILGIVSLIVVIAGTGLLLYRKSITPEEAARRADKVAVSYIEARRQDREMMERMEAHYQRATEMQQRVNDTAIGLLTAVAPFATRIETDDALKAFLQDIRSPGTEIERTAYPRSESPFDTGVFNHDELSDAPDDNNS